MKVEPDFVTYATLNEKISTSIASGSGYDVLVTGIGWIQPFAAKGVFQKLDKHGVTPDSLAKEVTQAMVPAVTYKDAIYGYPLTVDARAVALRKSAFEKAGLDWTKPPTSMTELKKVAEQLTVKNAAGTITRPGFDFNSSAGGYRQAFITFLGSTGNSLYKSGKENFNNAAGVETLNWMKSMFGDVQPFGQQNAAQKPMVFTGDAAMGLVGSSVDCSAKGYGKANCDDLSYFLMDSGKKAMLVGGNLASIGAGTKYSDPAWAFIEALKSPQALEEQSSLNMQIPATKDTSKSAIAQSNPLSQFVAKNLGLAIYEGGSTNWLDVRKEFNSGIDEVILGKRTAKEVLASLASQSK